MTIPRSTAEALPVDELAMLREDYIMRLVERVGQLMRKLIARRDEDDDPGALSLVREAYRDLFGLDPALIRMLDPESLRGLVSRPEDLPWIARVMRHEADLLRRTGRQTRADDTAVLALSLFAAASRAAPLDDTHGFDEDVDHLIQTTPADRLDPDLVATLRPGSS